MGPGERSIMSKVRCLFTFLKMARESSQIIVLCYRMMGQCDLSSESARRAFRGLRSTSILTVFHAHPSEPSDRRAAQDATSDPLC